jgi:hypothetical protein
MNRQPYRENIDLCSDANGQWFCCSRCARRICQMDQDWRAASKRKIFPPAEAGPLMTFLTGRYVFEKLFCPSCGALFNSEMVEDKHEK